MSNYGAKKVLAIVCIVLFSVDSSVAMLPAAEVSIQFRKPEIDLINAMGDVPFALLTQDDVSFFDWVGAVPELRGDESVASCLKMITNDLWVVRFDDLKRAKEKIFNYLYSLDDPQAFSVQIELAKSLTNKSEKYLLDGEKVLYVSNLATNKRVYQEKLEELGVKGPFDLIIAAVKPQDKENFKGNCEVTRNVQVQKDAVIEETVETTVIKAPEGESVSMSSPATFSDTSVLTVDTALIGLQHHVGEINLGTVTAGSPKGFKINFSSMPTTGVLIKAILHAYDSIGGKSITHSMEFPVPADFPPNDTQQRQDNPNFSLGTEFVEVITENFPTSLTFQYNPLAGRNLSDAVVLYKVIAQNVSTIVPA